MIYTITFNPALDVSGTVEELVPDEKSYVYDEIHTPGGNGINAAIIAHRLGAPVIATGLLGGGNGDEIKRLLDAFKVNHRFQKIGGNTRMNLTVSNKKTKKQTRLSFAGPKISREELKKLEASLLKLKANDLIVMGGSLPPGIRPQDVKTLVSKLKKKGHTVFVDMPGKILKEVIKAGPDFIKPNLTEFQDLVGEKVTSIKEALPLMRKLNESVPLVCISSIEEGAVLVSKNEAWYGKIPEVKINSTVGAGDSMVGAISFMVHRDPDAGPGELLRLGLAAACATLTQEGMVLGSKKSIQYYRSEIFLKEIR